MAELHAKSDSRVRRSSIYQVASKILKQRLMRALKKYKKLLIIFLIVLARLYYD